jgi:hypothetical protein
MFTHYCSYCNKKINDAKFRAISNRYCFLFCFNCIESLFGLKPDELKNIFKEHEIYKKIFNNYKLTKPFRAYIADLLVSECWFKNGVLVKEKNDRY